MKYTNYFFDTEFNDKKSDFKEIELISIGIVCEDGREYYAVSNEFNPSTCSEWVKTNVLTQLPPKDTWKSLDQIAKEIRSFIIPAFPQFWAWYGTWDFMLLIQLMGGWDFWPTAWPLYFNDLRTYLDWEGKTEKGQPPAQQKGKHNALEDAKWNQQLWYFLNT